MSNISLPCDKRESSGTMKVDRTEAQGGRAGIRELGSGVTSNQDGESLRGRRQAGIGLKGSLEIIRGESVVFSHFKDVTTKVSTVGSNSVMWAKRMVEGTHIGSKEPGATFNLESKRLDVGWTEIAFNEIIASSPLPWKTSIWNPACPGTVSIPQQPSSPV